jgi:hypothetical protein
MADQWLTYQQAGELLSVSAEAIRRHARRHRWRVQRGNDGKALVLVPPNAASEGWARPGGQQDGRPAGQRDGRPPGQAEHLPGHEELVAELRRRAEAAERAAMDATRRVEELTGEMAGQRERAARAESEAETLRGHLAREAARAEREAADRRIAEAQRHAAQAARDAAQAERDAARGELAEWRAGGPVARAWRAFLSRRGRP